MERGLTPDRGIAEGTEGTLTGVCGGGKLTDFFNTVLTVFLVMYKAIVKCTVLIAVDIIETFDIID